MLKLLCLLPMFAFAIPKTDLTDYVKVISSSSKKSLGQIHGSSSIKAKKAIGKNIYFLYGAEHLGLKNYYFDIPVVYNASVRKWMNYFLDKGKDFFVRYSERAGRYAPILGKILEDHGLPRDLIFLAMAESGFQTLARSKAAAVGAWQFMPFTARKFGLKINWYVDERKDPLKATIAACRYLKLLYTYYESWELAAAAYNAGEGKVNRAIRKYKTENFWDLRKGRYLKRETKNYVPKIMALAIIGKNLESFDLKEIDFHEPLDFDEIDVGPSTDLYLVSKELNLNFEDLKRLNPELLRWQTPPNKRYKLRIPIGKEFEWKKCCSFKDYSAKEYKEYTVKSYASLNAVSIKFRIPVDILANLNHIPKSKRLKRGTIVYLPFHSSHTGRELMYRDLYRRKRKRRKSYRARIRLAKRRGKAIKNPTEFYVVKKGDTLWDVSRKTGVSLDTLISTNYKIIKNRMIRAGDRLSIR